MARSLFLLVACAALIALAHPFRASVARSEAARRAAIPIVVPSALVATLTFAGDRILAADFYWLKALQYFGDSRYRVQSFDKLSPLLTVVADLDPKDCMVYSSAGLMLTSTERFDLKTADLLLERGVTACDDWYVPFVLAFNKYYFEWKPAEAAKYLVLAAQKPNVPPYVGDLAVRFLSQSGELENAEDMLLTMMSTTDDPEIKKSSEQRLQRVHTEMLLRRIDNAADKYAAAHGVRPNTVAELQSEGLVPHELHDPSGGTLYIDSTGAASTSAYLDRLQIRADAVPTKIEEAP